jgi:hypothetical protein
MAIKNSETPEEREARKTREERAEDIAYTINHALACTATDFIDPYVGNWTQKYLGKRFSIGCGHDHSHDHGHDHGMHCGPGSPTHDHKSHGLPGLPIIDDHDHHNCGHDHHHHKHTPDSHLTHWWLGEVIGDFGAVPVTIAFQRYAPGLMNGIRNLLEPVLRPVFKFGANMSARSWASKQGLGSDSEACKKKADEIYEHEVRHLPQALLWTASSIAINLTTQKLLGNTAPLWQLAAGKAAGASISAGLVVSGRALMPQTARNWDGWTSKNVFLPMTKALGSYAGITENDVERMAEKQKKLEGNSWANSVQSSGIAVDSPVR